MEGWEIALAEYLGYICEKTPPVLYNRERFDPSRNSRRVVLRGNYKFRSSTNRTRTYPHASRNSKQKYYTTTTETVSIPLLIFLSFIIVFNNS